MSIDRWSKGLQPTISGAVVAGTTISDSFNTDGVAIGPFRKFAVYFLTGTVTGTSVTLDMVVQISLDGGTTWFAMPDGANSQTGAALGQLTEASDDTVAFEWWETPGGLANSAIPVQVRVKGTVTGSSEIIPVVDFQFLFWDPQTY
jgi:hypothetical protein